MLTRVIVALADASAARRLGRALDQPNRWVEVMKSPGGRHDESVRAGRAWAELLRKNCDVVIVDRQLLPSPATSSVHLLRSLPESPEVVVWLDRPDPAAVAELMAAGASATLEGGWSDSLVTDTIRAVADRRQDRVVLGAPPLSERPKLSDFATASPRMRAFLAVVERVVRSDTTLLVTGETGVGKEHLARAIHAESQRSQGPFISINCGALPESLLESELFGHEEGAFTGASRSRRGWFELAHQGTIFLDEIGEMPIHLQVKLLQVLQTREIRRVGGDSATMVNVRVIAATHRDLVQEIEAQRFRVDLYYRLSVVTLHIPPLRERPEDIPTLAERFLADFQRRFATSVERISPAARDVLVEYVWPGNVRELANVIERALLLSSNEELLPEDLPLGAAGPGSLESLAGGTRGGELGRLGPVAWDRSLAEARQEVVHAFEREYLRRLLTATGGRIGETARRAGIQPRSLYEKMKRHGLRKEEFRR